VTSPYFLIYASTATRVVPQEELLDLLTRSRASNHPLGVTGLLLYSPGDGGQSGTFVQFLEGPRAVVQDLYLRITRDPRHRDWTVIREGTSFDRRFGDWSMGFRDLSLVRPEDLPGFNPIYLQGWTLSRIVAEPDPILQLLYSFAGV